MLGPDDLDAALSDAATACAKWSGLSKTASCPSWGVASIGGGMCAGMAYQSGGFAWDDEAGAWVSTTDFVTPLITGKLHFKVRGGRSLSIVPAEGDPYPLTYEACDKGELVFSGGGDEVCDGEPAATCGDDGFVVRVKCDACEGVVTPCSPTPVPKKLCVSFSNGTGGCDCLDGQGVTITYDPVIREWTGRYVGCGMQGDDPGYPYLNLRCVGSGWVLSSVTRYGHPADGCHFDTGAPKAPDTTDPFGIAWAGVVLANSSLPPVTNCCVGTVDIAVAPVPEDGCGDTGSGGSGNGDGSGDDCDNATGITCGQTVSATVPAGGKRWFVVDVPAGKLGVWDWSFSSTGLYLRNWDALGSESCPPDPNTSSGYQPVDSDGGFKSGGDPALSAIGEGRYLLCVENNGPEATTSLAVRCVDVPPIGCDTYTPSGSGILPGQTITRTGTDTWGGIGSGQPWDLYANYMGGGWLAAGLEADPTGEWSGIYIPSDPDWDGTGSMTFNRTVGLGPNEITITCGGG